MKKYVVYVEYDNNVIKVPVAKSKKDAVCKVDNTCEGEILLCK